MVSVPDVVGQTQADAEAVALRAAEEAIPSAVVSADDAEGSADAEEVVS